MKKRVFIFGIGGFVGHYLAEEFRRNNYIVYGSDIDFCNDLGKEITFYKADLLDFGQVYHLISDTTPDLIINLAGISSVRLSWDIPQTTMMVNIIGVINILEAVRKLHNISQIMFIGSSEEFGVSNIPLNEESPLRANNPYGISKVTQEQLALLYRERYNMRIQFVRSFNQTGVGQKDTFVLPNFCKQVADIEKSGRAGVILVGNLMAKRDFSHVRDVVYAYRMIFEKGDCSKIYNVGSGKAYSLGDLLEFVISLSNQQIRIEIDKNRFRPIDTPMVCCDCSLIERELGWKPRYTVFDALKELYESYLTD